MTVAIVAQGMLSVVRAADTGDPGRVTPGVLGFLLVALLGVATWLLVRSMNRQMKKIDIPPEGTPTRDENRGAQRGPDGAGPDGSAQR